MERCIHKYLYNFALSNNIISNFQSGFIKGDSTTNQLTYMYNDIVQALDEGTEVRAVFCDMSKAFDRVWHKGLLIKLKYIGRNTSGQLIQQFIQKCNLILTCLLNVQITECLRLNTNLKNI